MVFIMRGYEAFFKDERISVNMGIYWNIYNQAKCLHLKLYTLHFKLLFSEFV